jgi:hypothetical protein
MACWPWWRLGSSQGWCAHKYSVCNIWSFCVNICSFSCTALLKDARFSCARLNGLTFAQIVTCAGTYCCFKGTVTSYVMILSYVLEVSLRLHRYARPQCKGKGEVPAHDVKAHVGVELYIRQLLVSVLHGCEWSGSRAGHFTAGVRASVQI